MHAQQKVIIFANHFIKSVFTGRPPPPQKKLQNHSVFTFPELKSLSSTELENILNYSSEIKKKKQQGQQEAQAVINRIYPINDVRALQNMA